MIRCRCVWAGRHCSHPATQEDGLCDWCGVRTPEQLKGNPNAMWSPLNGEFLGLGGHGYDHVDPSRTPDACWMDNSGRDLHGGDHAADDEATEWSRAIQDALASEAATQAELDLLDPSYAKERSDG